MPTYQITASTFIKAPAEKLYAILADYRAGHPHILSKPYFTALEVEQGGIGAGTIIRIQMHVFGKMHSFRMFVTEPNPGCELVETDLASGTMTTSTVQPLGEKRHAQVMITTDLKTRGGVFGQLERFFTTRLLRRLYAQELELLTAFAERRMHAA